jgi:pimeloyl-ACP methyl ester carboxylesterase
MVSLLVGIPHSIDCDGAVDASSMLTCETPPLLPGRHLHTGGRLRQNAGSLQIGMLDGIRSEWWAPSDQNPWTASLGIRTQGLGSDGIAAFSQTDFTEDLKRITVPVLVMHSEDDQIVPYVASGPLSAKLLKNGTLKTYKDFPHGMPTTQADTINSDLLAFIKT